MASYQIFISYRRDGAEDLAGRISDTLKQKGYSVFYDIESMHSGTFNTQIYTAIEECQDVLLILPPNGLDRCSDPDDWVRLEIEHALLCQKNIIPVMMRGFVFPANLPEKLRTVPYLESVSASTEYFDAFVQRIEKLMDCSGPQGAAQGNIKEKLANGIRLLNYRQYDKADSVFAAALEAVPSDPDAYFYAAISLLRGKRPFLCTKPSVNQILELLTTASAIEDKAIYRYLMAYIKYDYHHSKMLRVVPDYAAELTLAAQLGINEAEKQTLFQLLNVQRPSGF